MWLFGLLWRVSTDHVEPDKYILIHSLIPLYFGDSLNQTRSLRVLTIRLKQIYIRRDWMKNVVADQMKGEVDHSLLKMRP